ncbi:pyridoxal phosphate-dependent aminotransferase [Nocardia ninae]|uniref:Aminotransferase n=1 Tax=Nocardia ninae NBRC 108245 TaxID=1210091 RepID=A0A511MGQ7_9NOCA|nr:pyridoxal phosphate-dependent aminotransferase [Nocardia ninae]GEM39769.1 aminotransferase [Nocardia ninae NBRC 108245]
MESPQSSLRDGTLQNMAGAALPVAERVGNLARSGLFGLLAAARGGQTIDLALGVPAVPATPLGLIEMACAALRDGMNQYEQPDGNIVLRQRIAAELSVPTDPATELTITVGATTALTAAILAVVDPGDEVVVFEPFYENFISAIALAGGVPRLVAMHAPDWRFDVAELRAVFGPRTKAVVLCTPNNPTGHMLTRAEFADIAELCERWNAVVISDEIYSGYVYAGHRHLSAVDLPALGDRSIVIGSLSKSHAVSGWRIGYLRANAALSRSMRQVHVAVCGGAAAPLQAAAARMAAAQPGFLRAVANLDAQRDLVVSMFDDIGLRCIPPDGGCYAIADIRQFTDEDCESLAYRLVREAGVMVAPGKFFYATESDGAHLVRVAFNRRLETLDLARQRLSIYQTSSSGRDVARPRR